MDTALVLLLAAIWFMLVIILGVLRDISEKMDKRQ